MAEKGLEGLINFDLPNRLSFKQIDNVLVHISGQMSPIKVKH